MNMRTYLFIFALLVGAALSVHRAEAQVSRPADDPLRHGHALLIGNSHYRDSHWPQLLDIPLQLDALQKGLAAHFDTVQVEEDLDTDQLLAKLFGFLRTYGNDSTARLFIYYSGHGYTETILQRNEYRGYITAIDTPHYVGTAQGYAAARLKAISMAEIRAPLEEVLAHSILFLFDSCFAGTMFTDRSGNDPLRPLTPEVVSDLMKNQSRDIITAGKSDQRVPAHSPIPELFLAALNGAADPYKQGVISSVDIYTYLFNRVANIRDINLTPQQGSLPNPAFAEGKFLFRVINPARAPDQVAVVTPRLVQPHAGPCDGGPASVSLSTRPAMPLCAPEERALKPKDVFKECEQCPEMVVVPVGTFTMGAPPNAPGRFAHEGPQHRVTFGRPFAVGQFALTFEEWDACVTDGGCNGYKPSDAGWGRGRRPVTNVSWNDAKGYVAWLSNKTGKTYRLLTEAEYEYATRAGTQTVYPWGYNIGKGNANCHDCGSQWDGKQTAPVGSFPANAFGLSDMVGNAMEWTEDCYHDSYNGAPADGSAWTTGGDCSRRVVRGGSWNDFPDILRSATATRTPLLPGQQLGFPGWADALTSLIFTSLPIWVQGRSPWPNFLSCCAPTR
jgi:formylglycine-generating enzyme required for sulfatase activity